MPPVRSPSRLLRNGATRFIEFVSISITLYDSGAQQQHRNKFQR
jgi:hypothetical protein